MKQAILEVKNVSKTFTLGEESIPVLKNVDLTIEKGDFIAIIERRLERHQGLVDRHQQLARLQRQGPLVAALAQGRAKRFGRGIVTGQAELVAAHQLTHLRKKQYLDHAFSPAWGPSWKWPDLPPFFSTSLTCSITMSFCTALHMS